MKSKDPASFGVRGAGMVFLSRLYGIALRGKLFLYGAGLLKRTKVEGIKVISIGNITAGGTGKTPVTIMVARLMKDKTAVVSRGYGRRSGEPVQVISDGSRILAQYPEAADEAVLTAGELSGIPVICSPYRADGIKTAKESFGVSTVILDDAFSHIQIEPDRNLLLIDALDPFGNGRLLPAGPLREPLTSLKRADAIVITRANLVSNNAIEEIKATVKKHALKELPFFRCSIKPEFVLGGSDGRQRAENFLKGRRVNLLSGIGAPEQFEEMIKNLGAEVERHHIFEDHHSYTDEELTQIKKSVTGDSILLTTAKDFVRVAQPMRSDVWVLTINAEIDSKDREAFLKFLEG